ncbi:hypothetical protein OGAPHI_002449 [Ogataea philodendri]|uniref:Uncharacterized protein n=1 Tax=Ogataea philodendri TaxID=1378263 RepID=A0A9P8PBU8_9ASCO|nr:uncharacterized protein OGAPHI_002449 [Ogataea philodendri]KAH3668695.1 hypothetical protein OGAPHI_002449 [Ogataea philodendri]
MSSQSSSSCGSDEELTGIANGDDGLTYLTDASLLKRTFLSDDDDDALFLRSAGLSCGLDTADPGSLSTAGLPWSRSWGRALLSSIWRIFGSSVLTSSSLACIRSSGDIRLSFSTFSRWICSFSERWVSAGLSTGFFASRWAGLRFDASGNPVAGRGTNATGAETWSDVSCSTISPSRSMTGNILAGKIRQRG